MEGGLDHLMAAWEEIGEPSTLQLIYRHITLIFFKFVISGSTLVTAIFLIV